MFVLQRIDNLLAVLRRFLSNVKLKDLNMAKNQAKQKEIVSPIHHDQIMTETIKKELKTMKLMTSFGYNAVKPSKR